MRRHTLIGARMLADSDSPVLQTAEQIALRHHERWDGAGYPQGLAGEADPARRRGSSRSPTSSTRCAARGPYKPPWSVDKAVVRGARGRPARSSTPMWPPRSADLDHLAFAPDGRFARQATSPV